MKKYTVMTKQFIVQQSCESRGWLKGMARLVSFVFCLIIASQVLAGSFAAAQDDSVCSTVKIEIQQEATLERQAFDAHMRINNNLAGITLENVSIEVSFADEQGNVVLVSSDPAETNALFFIRAEEERLSNITNITGSGIVLPETSADIHWLIIPAPGASNGLEQGAMYFVGATLEYTIGGEVKTTVVSPDFIYVKPMPELVLDYFLPSDVYGDDAFTVEIEPPVPFSLGVRVKNSGSGKAQNLKIESAQPEIIENEQGLLVGFQIEGAEVNGLPAASSLRVDFGDIDPNRSGVVRWIMSTSLSGQFVEFSAGFSHADELGGELTSLIAAIDTHFLVHDVLVDLPGRDTIRDFLAMGGVDAFKIYESGSVDTDVSDQSGVSSLLFISQSGSKETYALTAPVTAGFLYISLTDPFGGQKVIKEVVRSDGKRINTANFWLSKTRGAGNSWQYFINFFDANSTGNYRVVFDDGPNQNNAPVLQFIPDRIINEGQTLSFVVEASDPDGSVPSLTVASLPVGGVFTDQGDLGNGNATGSFEWTPIQGQAGEYTILFTASDGKATDTQRVLITVYREGDTDGDGYLDVEEISAGSDPNDPDSTPEISTVTLSKGYNQVSFPADMAGFSDLESVLGALGGESIVDSAKIFYPATQTFGESWYESSVLAGDNPGLLKGDNPNLIIFAKNGPSQIEFQTKYCVSYNLEAGVNLIGSGCVPSELTAFKLLQAIGNDTVVTSVQRFNIETGEFENASYFQGIPVGTDFHIVSGEGYFVYMKLPVSSFKIHEIQ